MRKTLLSAASVFAILAGTALAQNATAPDTSKSGQAPAATAPAPAQPTAPAEKMAKPGTMQPGSQAQSGQQQAMPSTSDNGGAMTQQPSAGSGSTTAEQPSGTTGSTTAQQPQGDTGAPPPSSRLPMAGARPRSSRPRPTRATGRRLSSRRRRPPARRATRRPRRPSSPPGRPSAPRISWARRSTAPTASRWATCRTPSSNSSTGKIEKLVISSGGFLGIGAKTIALDMSQVQMAPGEGIKAHGVTQDEVEKMPEYKVAQATQSLEPTASSGTWWRSRRRQRLAGERVSPRASQPAPQGAPGSVVWRVIVASAGASIPISR